MFSLRPAAVLQRAPQTIDGERPRPPRPFRDGRPLSFASESADDYTLGAASAWVLNRCMPRGTRTPPKALRQAGASAQPGRAQSLRLMMRAQERAAKISLAFRAKEKNRCPVEATAPNRPVVFVVEDEPTLRALVRKVLERAGYNVIEAGSGLAALELWLQKKPQVDLLLTDMVMPDGISGRQLAEKLKAENPRLKVIFTSGYSSDLIGKDFVVKEGLNFLQKPYPPQLLVQTVRNSIQAE